MTVELNCGTGHNQWIWYDYARPVLIKKDGSFKGVNLPTARGKGTVPAGVATRIAAIQGRFTSTKMAVGKITAVRTHGGCHAGAWSFTARYAGHQ